MRAAVLWLATGINILGLERAKWLQNLGGLATWLVGALVLCGGAVAWYRFGAATPILASTLVPDLKSSVTLASFSTIILVWPLLFRSFVVILPSIRLLARRGRFEGFTRPTQRLHLYFASNFQIHQLLQFQHAIGKFMV